MKETFLMMKTPLQTVAAEMDKMAEDDHLLILGMLNSGLSKKDIRALLYLKNRFFIVFDRYHGIGSDLPLPREWKIRGYSVQFDPMSKRSKRYAHRKTMEIFIGRPLRFDEHVHHIDMNTANNELINLSVLTAKQHSMRHAQAKSLVPDLVRKGLIKFDGEKYYIP